MIDVAAAPRLRTRLDAAMASLRPVVLDLEQTSYLDAAGTQVLLARIAARRGCEPR